MKLVALLLALVCACSPTYYGMARVTHAKRTCPPIMLINMDFALVLAGLAGSALAFKADHGVRGGLEFVGAFGLVFGTSVIEAQCTK